MSHGQIYGQHELVPCLIQTAISELETTSEIHWGWAHLIYCRRGFESIQDGGSLVEFYVSNALCQEIEQASRRAGHGHESKGGEY